MNSEFDVKLIWAMLVVYSLHFANDVVLTAAL